MLAKIIGHLFEKALLAVNMVAVLGLLLSGNSDLFYPPDFPWLANAGLVFPFFIVANGVFLLLWLLVKPRRSVLSVVGFVLAFSPIRTYCPLNVSGDVPDGCIKLVSYNVALLDSTLTDDTTGKTVWPALEYIHQSKADIVCLQEAWLNPDRIKALQRDYPYWDSIITPRGGVSLVVATRFPIVGKKPVVYPSTINGSGVFLLKIDDDTVHLMNNHLESNSLTRAERGQFDDIVNGHANSEEMKTESRTLYRKITQAAVRRAPQADSIAKYVTRQENTPLIVCGDFNSCPNSYVIRKLGRLLTDCYRAAGLGLGWSYNRNSIDVRIDHVFCSSHFKPVKCLSDRENAVSDHNPLICWLKKMPK